MIESGSSEVTVPMIKVGSTQIQVPKSETEY